MILNHINLPVNDVAGAVRFFESNFDFKCAEVKGDNLIAVLTGKNGFELVLMCASMSQSKTHGYPKAFHIGFMLDSEDEIYEIYNKMKISDIVLENEPKKIRGTLGFYFYFEEILIEIGKKD